MWISLLFTVCSSTVTLPIKPLHQSRIPTIKTYSSPSGSLNVSNYYNLQYYTTLEVGTPGQPSSLIIDTGSSYTWVPSTNCTCHESSTRFYSNQSSTFKSSGDMIVLNYGMGMVSGELFTDKLSLGSLTINNQDLVLVYKDKDLDGLAASGLLGLAFNDLSDGKKTVIENLKDQNMIEKAEFSIYMNNLYENSTRDSALIIGGIDSSYVGGEGITLDINKDFGFWIINIQSSNIGDQSVNQERMGIVDTGTSFLYVPNDEFAMIFLELNKTKEFLFDSDGYRYFECNKSDIELMPDLWITVQSKSFKISSKNYLYYENFTCYLFIEENDSEFWLMGQVFIREYYMLFSMDPAQLTLYPISSGDVQASDVSSGTLAAGVGMFALVCVVLSRRHRTDEKVAFDYISLDN